MTDNLSPQMRDKILAEFERARLANNEACGNPDVCAEELKQILNPLTVEDEGTYRNCDVCPYLEGLPKPLTVEGEIYWNDVYGNSG